MGSVRASHHFLRPLAPLGLLVLSECLLVPLDLHSAVLTGCCGCLANPVGGAITHQFPPLWIDASPLLVARQCWGSGHKPRLQAAEQKGLPSQVLRVEGGPGGRHQRSRAIAAHSALTF